MKEIKVDIGSEEWLEIRRNSITASESSIFLGINPWMTLLQLYDSKINGTSQKMNPAMRRGIEREHEGREWFDKTLGVKTEPKMIQHSTFPWKVATLDAVSADGKIACEIKFASAKVHELAKQGQVIDYYYSQVQSQICCLGIRSMYFLSCHEKDGVVDFALVKVDIDQEYMLNLFNLEQDFYYDHLLPKIPPEPSDKDCQEIKSDKRISFDLMCEEYLRINEQIKNLTEIKEDIMRHLKSEVGSSSCSASYSLKKSVIRGSYDYKKYFDAHVDLLKFVEKKTDTESWRITKN